MNRTYCDWRELPVPRWGRMAIGKWICSNSAYIGSTCNLYCRSGFSLPRIYNGKIRLLKIAVDNLSAKIVKKHTNITFVRLWKATTLARETAGKKTLIWFLACLRAVIILGSLMKTTQFTYIGIDRFYSRSTWLETGQKETTFDCKIWSLGNKIKKEWNFSAVRMRKTFKWMQPISSTLAYKGVRAASFPVNQATNLWYPKVLQKYSAIIFGFIIFKKYTWKFS